MTVTFRMKETVDLTDGLSTVNNNSSNSSATIATVATNSALLSVTHQSMTYRLHGLSTDC